MATDLTDIEQTLQLYFDGMYEGDLSKLAAAFHEVAHLFGVVDGELTDWTQEHWFDVMRKRGTSPASQGLQRNDFIVHIDRSSPTTAFAKVQCQVPPRYFTDYLALVKLKGGWKIVSKTYHTEIR